MVTDKTWQEEKMSNATFKKAISIVTKFIKNGGKLTDERYVYPNYPTQDIAIQYWRYNEMKTRWDSYIKKNGKEPNDLYIQIPAEDISNDDKVLPISTFVDMEKRVTRFIDGGGKPEQARRVYLDMSTRLEYISFAKYQDLLTRCNAWRNTHNGANPNFLYILKKTNSNSTTRPDAVGDDLKPNGDGWYLSPRYKSNSSAIKQETLYWCACNMLQQLIYELTGKWISESYIAKLAGTTTSGTGHDGINSALKKIASNLGVTWTINWTYFSDLGYDQLGKLIKEPKIGTGQHSVYKLKWGHYEYIIGVNPSTNKVLVANSLSGGWLEYRTFATNTKYINANSQKSILEVMQS